MHFNDKPEPSVWTQHDLLTCVCWRSAAQCARLAGQTETQKQSRESRCEAPCWGWSEVSTIHEHKEGQEWIIDEELEKVPNEVGLTLCAHACLCVWGGGGETVHDF